MHAVFVAHPHCAQILRELHKSCQEPDGSDDQKKGTQLLEVYALDIQMCTAKKNHKELKVVNLTTLSSHLRFCSRAMRSYFQHLLFQQP